MPDLSPVTVAAAAQALGLHPSTVRRDVARGCPGIVCTGTAGRGRGALLDLEIYRTWREGKPAAADAVLEIVADVAARVVRELGGSTSARQKQAAFIALAIYVRTHQAILRLEPAEIPPKLRAVCAVLTESAQEDRP